MPRRRTFDMGPPPAVDDRVSFELTGAYTSRPDERWTETFTTYPLAPAAVLESLTLSMAIDPNTGIRRYSTTHCMEFVLGVMLPEDRQRFQELCEDPERMVGLIDLVHVVSWLSDELTLRPTPPSSASTPGGARRDGEVTPEAAVGSPA
jgi:hypothetical protein